MDAVVDSMLGSLAKVADLPETRVSLVRLRERPAAVGNHSGSEIRGPLGLLGLKSLRLQGEARYQLRARTAEAADGAAQELQKSLLEARDALRAEGFLRLETTDVSDAEHSTIWSWLKTVSYTFLYEHRYLDHDESFGLITGIEVRSPGREDDTPSWQTRVTSPEMVRWDGLAAPRLRVYGPLRVGHVSALTHVPETAPGYVTLLRSHDGAAGSPASYYTVADFLRAIAQSDATVHPARVSFPTLTDFLTQLDTVAEPVPMGDAEGNAGTTSYGVRALSFEPPIALPTRHDFFEITFGADALDRAAVVYLKIHQAGRRTKWQS